MSSTPDVLDNLPPFEQLVQAPDRAPFRDEPEVVHLDFVGAEIDPEAQSLDIPTFGIGAYEPPRRRLLRWLRG